MQGCPVFLSLFFPHLFLSVAAPLASTHTHIDKSGILHVPQLQRANGKQSEAKKTAQKEAKKEEKGRAERLRGEKRTRNYCPS